MHVYQYHHNNDIKQFFVTYVKFIKYNSSNDNIFCIVNNLYYQEPPIFLCPELKKIYYHSRIMYDKSRFNIR